MRSNLRELFIRNTKSLRRNSWPLSLQHAECPKLITRAPRFYTSDCAVPSAGNAFTFTVRLANVHPSNQLRWFLLREASPDAPLPHIVLMAPSPGCLFPSQHSHQNWVAGSPLGSPTSWEGASRAGGTEPSENLPFLLPYLRVGSPMSRAISGQPLPGGRSCSWLRLPAPSSQLQSPGNGARAA